jgi:hypothetical protein
MYKYSTLILILSCTHQHYNITYICIIDELYILLFNFFNIARNAMRTFML